MKIKYSIELKAALGLMVIQFLFKITFEIQGGLQLKNVPIMDMIFFLLLV